MLDTKTIKKILILRYRFIGDTVLTIPFIKNVRKHFPDVQIDILVSPNSGEILEGNPDLNNIFYYDNSKFHKYERTGNEASRRKGETYTTYNSFIDCAKGLRSENYDLAFVLKRSFSSALLAALSGIKYKVGFNTELRSFLLTHPVKYDKNIHELDNYLNCLRVIGIEPYRYSPEIFPTDFEKSKANGFLVRLDRYKPKVLIHASSAHPYKQWPKRYFAKLMDYLFKEYEAQFVFTGAKSDKLVYEEIIKLCENRKKFKFLDLCGLTNLRECYSVYKGLDLAISTDSGNAHLAAASGIPTYVLYGPTRPEKWLPIGRSVFPLRLNQLLPCQPCDVKVQCSHLSCMKLLTPNFVFHNLINNKLIEKKRLTV
ncbi:MAG: hypothetical protein A3B68_02780 [Candidatus Melainabacteria bacterium RIFCSPHIGHO2_02_FULL_34_12]|nr:MAG: hypothetical protein A3B68_02780 [Candidatus Melainabacteria bacterium RIFCSPHIGHO2_02_FULL_34_12]